MFRVYVLSDSAPFLRVLEELGGFRFCVEVCRSGYTNRALGSCFRVTWMASIGVEISTK